MSGLVVSAISESGVVQHVGEHRVAISFCSGELSGRRPRLRHCLLEDLFPTQIRCPACRFMSAHGQLVVLDDAATVDLVLFNIANSTTFSRPVPSKVSLSFVPFLVGEPSARRPGRCCSSRPRLRHCLPDDLFQTLFRCPSCVSSVRDGSMLAIAHQI